MTKLIMPSEYGMDMLVGSSPVLGSGFLGGSPYFNDYSRCAQMWSHSTTVTCLTEPTPTITAKSITSSAAFNITTDSPFCDGLPITTGLPSQTLWRQGPTRKLSRESLRRRKLGTSILPPPELHNLKSCLISRADEQTPEGATSPSREKKKVSFADMIGGNLTHIKIITERPDCPPRWSQDFLDQVTGGAKAEALPDQWALTFSQPAADYMVWKTRLERDNVALENVVIHESESLLQGTLKVRNIAFHKEVIVRYTIDNWATHKEVIATYVSCPASGSSYNLYDTFSFQIPLPSSSQADKIEFCVSYNTDGATFWDSNNDKNYVVVSFRSKSPPKSDKPEDLYNLTLDSWSEFSAWNNLKIDDESPYW